MAPQKQGRDGGSVARATSIASASSGPRRAHATTLGALAGVLGGALLLAFWAWPTAPTSANVVAPQEAAAPTPKITQISRAFPEQDPEAPPSPDSARVRAAFVKFQATLKDITKEKLEAEQARIRGALEVARNIPTPDPTIEAIKDESGLRWNKLTYPSGEVRYEFPTD